jgi:protein-tyrosine phosphatase
LGSDRPFRVLFVCSGNICRSPLAEAIFRAQVREAGLEDRFEIDSAGMHGYHEGDGADPRTCRTARRFGVDVTSISRPVRPSDLERFDLLVAMDRGHRRQLLAQGADPARVVLMRDYEPGADSPDVPDPYYGGESGFEAVHRLVEKACRGLLEDLRQR